MHFVDQTWLFCLSSSCVFLFRGSFCVLDQADHTVCFSQYYSIVS